MKKLLTTCLLLFVGFMGFSQTIVSTTPENKKVILEEFTGVNCTFCPQGHAIANSIKANNPDTFFVINIHQGGFANPSAGQPDFRTPFGNAIVAQSYFGAGFGYPSGTINRQNFPGREMTNAGTTAMGRNNWSASATDALNESSYVNVGVESEINVTTNELTVHVEAYYTGDSPQATNKLNVALLQNNTKGPQVGGNMGDQYPHEHRLVHLLTGQWGVDVTTTTQGSFVDQTFTYTIPEDYNGISADVFEGEFEIVAFITETQQNIISGDGAFATYTGLPNTNDVTLKNFIEFDAPCDGAVVPKFQIQNLGTSPITSLAIEYSVNGGTPLTYNWTGNLGSLIHDEIELPESNFEVLANNQLVINIPNDEDVSNNEIVYDFSLSEFDANQFNFTLELDNYPDETTWNVRNSAGAVVYSGGPYNGQQQQTINQTFTLDEEDCYTFRINDSFGDGICCSFGQGSYTITTADGETVASGGQFGSSEVKSFRNFETLSTPSFDVYNFNMYPNPTDGVLYLSANENFSYEIYNLQGKKIKNDIVNSVSSNVNLSEFSSGIYLVKVTINGVSETHKLILK